MGSVKGPQPGRVMSKLATLYSCEGVSVSADMCRLGLCGSVTLLSPFSCLPCRILGLTRHVVIWTTRQHVHTAGTFPAGAHLGVPQITSPCCTGPGLADKHMTLAHTHDGIPHGRLGACPARASQPHVLSWTRLRSHALPVQTPFPGSQGCGHSPQQRWRLKRQSNRSQCHCLPCRRLAGRASGPLSLLCKPLSTLQPTLPCCA